MRSRRCIAPERLIVVIDLHEDLIKKIGETQPDLFRDMLYVVGDATEEETLSKAGIERAKGLITALPEDKDNLVVTVVVHQKYPRSAYSRPLRRPEVF